MDNLGSHKVKAVRNAIRSGGAKLFFPPKYSPDLNPILLRKAAARTSKPSPPPSANSSEPTQPIAGPLDDASFDHLALQKTQTPARCPDGQGFPLTHGLEVLRPNDVSPFCAVGVINTLVGLSIIFGLMRFADADFRSANAVGYALGFMLSYALNRSWTFAYGGDVFRSAMKWTLVVATAYGLNLAVVIVMHKACGLNAYLAQAFGVPTYTLVSFFGARLFAFPSRQPHLHVRSPQWQAPTNRV